MDITHLYREFKSETERKQYIVAQHKTITELSTKIEDQKKEIDHLKGLLSETVPLVGNPVERIIVSPEEGMIDQQIDIIRQRALGTELDLEEVKKLDILLKNKLLFKERSKTIAASSKELVIPTTELLALVKKNDNS